ncbi:MAG: hypothetical protein JWR35_3537 [Marmoricola sp.]|nr:hypothetical protein [Marmoricola sp.]
MLKIRAVEAIPVRVPRVHASESAFGIRSHTDAGIVRIEASDGVVGWGEISLVWWRLGSGLCEAVNEILAPALIGEDPMAISRIMEKLRSLLPGKHDGPALAGIEMALIDLVGRETSLPAYMFLGGAFRTKIDLSMSLHIAEPSAVAAEATKWVAQGFSTLKIKMGRDWNRDRLALEAVRSAVGAGVRLRVDVNEGWSSVPLAASRLDEMRQYDVELVEQPLGAEDLIGMRELRARSSIPLAIDDGVWTARDASDIIRERAADVLNVYVSESGGMIAGRHIAEVARTAGLQCWVGSMPELGIGTAANAHLAAAMPELSLASDVCGFLYHAADVLTTPLVVDNGSIAVPTGPGLGIEVDSAAVENWRLRA